MSRNVRTTVFAAVLLLIASVVQALPPAGASQPGLLDSVWAWVASWLSPVWEKEGCQMDPNGQCKPAEGRSGMPDRRGLTPSWEAAGCQMDPDGKPCPSVSLPSPSSERIGAVRRGRN